MTPPTAASVRQTEQERIAAQRQRELVLQKLSSFFGADDDNVNDEYDMRDETEQNHPLSSTTSTANGSEDCHNCSPTSVFHVDHPHVQQLYDKKKTHEAKVFQPPDHQNTSVNQDSQDDNYFKPLQRYHSLPNPGTPPTSSSSSTLFSSKSRNSSKSSLKQSGSSRSLKGNVSFTNLSIREYNLEIGDNPSCSYGVPISLGWDYEERHESLGLMDDDWDDDVNDYATTSSATALVTDVEETTQNCETTSGGGGLRRTKTKKKKPHELLLSYNERRRLLKRAGYSQQELKECLQTVQRVKLERGMTELFLATAPLEDAMETVVQGVQDFFRSVVTGGGLNNNQSEDEERHVVRTTSTATLTVPTTTTDIESSSAEAAAAAILDSAVEDRNPLEEGGK
jgi:hypothetical protein